MFEVAVQMEIADGYEPEMNIPDVDLSRIMNCIDWTDKN